MENSEPVILDGILQPSLMKLQLVLSIYKNDPSRTASTSDLSNSSSTSSSVTMTTTVSTTSFTTRDANIGSQIEATLFSDLVQLITTAFEKFPTLEVFPTCYVNEKLFSLDYFKENYVSDASDTIIKIGDQNVDLRQVVPDFLLSSFTGKRYKWSDIALSSAKVIGIGGYATIYKCPLDGEMVALKCLNLNCGESITSLSTHSTTFQEFRHEIEIQGNLKHPNILQILGLVVQPFVIIMELCPHGDLHSVIGNLEIPITWPLKLKLSMDITNGLKFLQAQTPPIAHIDLKSPNILVKSLNPIDPTCAKIADFGTSQPVFEPFTYSPVDNPVWQAPEMILGQEYDHKADTYSLGVILWELVTRKRYFGNLSFVSDIADSVVAGLRPPIPTNCCPPQFEDIIRSCWQQNPLKRPNMAGVLVLLNELCPISQKLEETIGDLFMKDLIKEQKMKQEHKLQKYILEKNTA
eukprot:TRINITY_DN12557_c0_g1_i1.p1 TRINITY_DN12557_c0_g1~~TRINITY_DN12557_c0_g1_i1.p1  ORF type:complete len:465 (-),score=94.19 TRINITY_DN12557_c0_g1_i1:124-1518(-)